METTNKNPLYFISQLPDMGSTIEKLQFLDKTLDELVAYVNSINMKNSRLMSELIDVRNELIEYKMGLNQGNVIKTFAKHYNEQHYEVIGDDFIDEFIKTSSIPQEKWGTHITHCCAKHGCKYRDKDCPVVLGLVKQEGVCEFCYDERGETISV